ncbi:BMT4_4 [Blepharisma stoltei]|uniref:Uncharacterized protein n=1 Tax=Blepharisma stoltei TaxID=1481888 RepID=A0AAU9J4R8_9CILI|nr:unnamed protein product [Blepharisma stoltei]
MIWNCKIQKLFWLGLLLCLYKADSSVTEGPKLIHGCPYFDINSQIRILEKVTQYDDKEILNIYSKDFLNKEYLTNIVKNAMPSTYSSRIKSNDDIRYLHPSAMWIPERNLFLVAVRVWALSRICYLYVTFFDSDWKEIRTEDMVGSTKVPSILNIPSDWNVENSGPEDGRLFRALKDEFFIIFNMKKSDSSARPMYMYRFSTGSMQELSIPEHREKAFVIEKNWSPIIIDDSHIYFVYNFENFQVIDCTDEGPCKRVQGDFKRKPGFLRGGSPYVRLGDTNYYLSLGIIHAEYPKQVFCHVYRPVLTIVQAFRDEPSFELIYTSEPFDFEKRIFLYPPGHFRSLNDMHLCDGPMSWTVGNSIAKLDMENDISDMIFTLGDARAVSLKAIGLSAVVNKIIETYELGNLPVEDKCSEKLTKFYFNLDDLSLPKIGNEEVEYQKKIGTQPKSCEKGLFLNNEGECKRCHNWCSDCLSCDYCTSCSDINAKPLEGYCLCQDGYFFHENSKSCKSCSEGCAKCSDFQNCLKCKNANMVVDNGACKCLEGFLEVFHEELKSYICEDYEAAKKYSCYKSHKDFSEIDKSDYENFHSVNLGYQLNNDKLSVALSSKDSAGNQNSLFEETQYFDFDVSRNKNQNQQASFIKDGILFEINIKIAKS